MLKFMYTPSQGKNGKIISIFMFNSRKTKGNTFLVKNKIYFKCNIEQI